MENEAMTMRAPCKFCQGTEGRIETRNGQDCMFCLSCGRHCYNAPKTETGRKPRTVSTTHEGISASRRWRIIERASARCEICGKREGILHVGHVISVKTGQSLGMSDAQINDDENLICACDECNLGMSDVPIPVRVLVGVVLARIANRQSKEAVDDVA